MTKFYISADEAVLDAVDADQTSVRTPSDGRRSRDPGHPIDARRGAALEGRMVK